MNRREFLQSLLALPFAGALWRRLINPPAMGGIVSNETARRAQLYANAGRGFIMDDDIIDTRPPLFFADNDPQLGLDAGVVEWSTIQPPVSYDPEPVELVRIEAVNNAPDQLTIIAYGSNGDTYITRDGGWVWESIKPG